MKGRELEGVGRNELGGDTAPVAAADDSDPGLVGGVSKRRGLRLRRQFLGRRHLDVTQGERGEDRENVRVRAYG